MRSYALFLALAVLHARAATIPAPETEKKLSIGNDALDNVLLDNNESEQELAEPANTVKDVENNLRNSIPENVPVKIIEEQPIIKTIPLNENSNDYVPDNDDSTNIKRVEIDLKNPGPPQRQEHDSQKPVAYSYVDKERAVAAIKQSIAESQNIFTRGINEVTQKFKYYFANNDELNEVSKNIQNLKTNFGTEVVKLTNTINSHIKPGRVEVVEGAEEVEIPSSVKEVENRLKTLETNFNYGVGMLSEGVELLSILKEEDEQNLKISGKADNENVPAEAGAAPVNPAPSSTPSNPTVSNSVVEYLQNINNTVVNAFNNLGNAIQNFFNPSQNQNQNPSVNATSQGGFNPANFFQGITFPNIFQQNQNTNPQQPQQGTAPAGTQSDEGASTESPNIFQQIQNTFQNIVSPGQPSQQQTQQNQNPISQFLSGVNQGFTNINQGIANFFQPKPGAQQTPQQTNQPNVASQPAVAVPAEGTNSVPAVPIAGEPPKPAKQPEPIENAQSGPIQQIVQNNPIVKGITNAVQKIQGISNPSKPRDTNVENPDSKGPGGAANGDYSSGVDEVKSAPINEQPETIKEIEGGDKPTAELNKTE